jgi:hypothetical protein
MVLHLAHIDPSTGAMAHARAMTIDTNATRGCMLNKRCKTKSNQTTKAATAILSAMTKRHLSLCRSVPAVRPRRSFARSTLANLQKGYRLQGLRNVCESHHATHPPASGTKTSPLTSSQQSSSRVVIQGRVRSILPLLSLQLKQIFYSMLVPSPIYNSCCVESFYFFFIKDVRLSFP